MTSNDTPRAPQQHPHPHPHPHPHVGMWVTADGFIRQELLPDGRYDEARGNRRSAYTGSYTVTGDHIDYVDDTGFTATGDVRDGVLFHEHLVLYREGDEPARR
ncbi:Atu4866 domain-containing protein [Streptomyces sp. NPDC020951]|uniref:Atu4866 domain-containing protein n=1 Tax=Streptomyces sp. NPDC020951 TaxID=3365104 RepID=UPI00379C84ED